MASTDWLRTFVCAYQAGSISEAARLRHLSQPAATGHVRALEAAAGTALFTRRRDGVVPTEAGRRLYAEVADPLDRLTAVLAGLDGGKLPVPAAPLRLGAGPDIFGGLLLDRLGPADARGPVRAVFGSDDDLLAALERDEVDLVVTAAAPARRHLVSSPAGELRYALVSPPAWWPDGFGSLGALADGLRGAPWASFSSDLPRTRRFWKRHLGRPFDAELRLVAPDLRVVLAAVEAGVGVSLLPTLVCDPALARGTVRELFDVRPLIAPRPLWATCRTELAERADVAAVLAALHVGTDTTRPYPPAAGDAG